MPSNDFSTITLEAFHKANLVITGNKFGNCMQYTLLHELLWLLCLSNYLIEFQLGHCVPILYFLHLLLDWSWDGMVVLGYVFILTLLLINLIMLADMGSTG